MRALPLILIAALIALPAGAQTPAPPQLARAFGNTIVSTYPDGRTGLLWLKADGTYSGKGRRRLDSSGSWTFSRGKVCLKQLKPTRQLIRYCTPLPAADSWTARAVTGEKITVRLVPGIAEPK